MQVDVTCHVNCFLFNSHFLYTSSAQLYAEEQLPPVEEEESDRQQRVYRGQPSTIGQVQRDRDGIYAIHNVNSLPNHAKVGSFAFNSAAQDTYR